MQRSIQQMKNRGFLQIEESRQFRVENDEQLRDIQKYIVYLRQTYEGRKIITGGDESNSNCNSRSVCTQDKKLNRLNQILSKIRPTVVLVHEINFHSILQQAILLAKSYTHPLTIELIISLLSPELKFQSQTTDQQQQNQSIKNNKFPNSAIALASQPEESIIALPYDNNSNSLVIVSANKTSGDVDCQQYVQQSQKYLIEDDNILSSYLQHRFITVKRQGITKVFQQAVQEIVTEFIQPVINEQLLLSFRIDQLISFLKLIEHISSSIYTYYLLSLLKNLSQTILSSFSQIEEPQIVKQQHILAQELKAKIKRTEYDQIISLFKTLSQRWAQHTGEFNIQTWQFQMEKTMILTFLSSSISQKQLHSIKTLIDRMHKVQYNSYSVISEPSLIKFIQQNHILQKVYRPQNHPQVIIKGKQVFEFISKCVGLGKQMIDLIFEMIAKSNQGLGKELYLTLGSVGYQNLQQNKEYIMERIEKLPREGLIYQETFGLIESLILQCRLQKIRESLMQTAKIIKAHYLGLKPELQQKLLNIYFEVYLMGVEQGIFSIRQKQKQIPQQKEQMQISQYNQNDPLMCLRPFLVDTQIQTIKRIQNQQIEQSNRSKSQIEWVRNKVELMFMMVGTFVDKLKEQLGRKIGNQCKHILSEAVKCLFKQYKIHHITHVRTPNLGNQNINSHLEVFYQNQHSSQVQKRQLVLVKQLLQCVDNQQVRDLITQEQVELLMERDGQMARYLGSYSSPSQRHLLQRLLKKPNLTQKDINNIIQSYSYLTVEEDRQKILHKLVGLFMATKDIKTKQLLVGFIIKSKKYDVRQVQQLVQKCIKAVNLITKNETGQSLDHVEGALMIFRQSLLDNDDRYSYGQHPAFGQVVNSRHIKVAVVSLCDQLHPVAFQVSVKSYDKLKDILLQKILPIINRKIEQVKIKIDKAQQYIKKQELNNRLSDITPYEVMSLCVEENISGNQLSWGRDDSILINQKNNLNQKNNQLKPQIVEVLEQVFNQYSSEQSNQLEENSFHKQQSQWFDDKYQSVTLRKNRGTKTKKYIRRQDACRLFAQATGVEAIDEKDGRIMHLFNNYSESGEVLTMREWINFYWQSALANPQLVISNLTNLGYGGVIEKIVGKENYKRNNDINGRQNINMMGKLEGDGDQNNNVFREYFGENQGIYDQLIFLNRQLTEKEQVIQRREKKVIRERVKELGMEVLLLLPKWVKLEREVISQFSIDDMSNKNGNNQPEKQQTKGNNKDQQPLQEERQQQQSPIVFANQSDQNKYQSNNLNRQSLEIVLMKTMYLAYYLRQQKNSITNLPQIEQYCLQQMNSIYNQLLFSDSIESIDPLNLTYRQHISISELQNIANIVSLQYPNHTKQVNSTLIQNKDTHSKDIISVFSHIRQLKQLLGKQVCHIKPIVIRNKYQQTLRKDFLSIYNFPQEQNRLRKRNQQYRSQQVIRRLSSLCQINYNMVATYLAALIALLDDINIEKHSQTFPQRILLLLVWSKDGIFNENEQLSKLVNRSVFLLSESLPQQKTHYMSSVLSYLVKQTEQQNKNSYKQYIKSSHDHNNKKGRSNNNELTENEKKQERKQEYQKQKYSIQEQRQMMVINSEWYFVTVNQLIIVETESKNIQTALLHITQLLQNLLNQYEHQPEYNLQQLKLNKHQHLRLNKQKHQDNRQSTITDKNDNVSNSSKTKPNHHANDQINSLLLCIEPILNCLTNILSRLNLQNYLNLKYLKVQQHDNDSFELIADDKQVSLFERVVNIMEKLLLSEFYLSSTSQRHVYEILSITNINNIRRNNISRTNHNNNNKNLILIDKLLEGVTIKRNSKHNAQNQSSCGIYNLGCICYINAIFQQLYHIQPFTQYLLTTETIDYPQQTQQQVQPYFKQFQKILYFMRYSHRQFITTEKFCQSFIGYTNQPINVKEQHDTDEFLNQLLDKLQKTYLNHYKIPESKTIVNQLFQGAMSNMITCQSCQSIKVNQQNFYVLSLQIKGLNSLKECLDKMVSAQVICDYYCSHCDQKVSQIHKERKFSYLPKILFIHFQRLVFDLETFTKIKLQNPILFQQEINLKDYFYRQQQKNNYKYSKQNQYRKCKDNKESGDSKYRYRLLGFVVHFGNSEGGHYISLIKSKDNKGRQIWRKYDDYKIGKWFWKAGVNEKDNAYLLIYERIQNQQVKEETVNQSEQRQQSSTTNPSNIINPSSIAKKHHKQQLNARVGKLNEKLIQQVRFDNIELSKEITIMRSVFAHFLISQLQQSLEQQQLTKLQTEEQICSVQSMQKARMLNCKIIISYLLAVQKARSIGILQCLPFSEKQLEKLVALLIASNDTQQTAQYLLNMAVETQLVRMVYSSAQKSLRRAFALILSSILINYDQLNQNKICYLIPNKQAELMRKMLVEIESALHEVGKSPNKMNEYFECLFLTISRANNIKTYYSEMNLVSKLVHFIMGRQSELHKHFGFYFPLNITQHNNKISSNNKQNAFLSIIIDIIVLYVEDEAKNSNKNKNKKRYMMSLGEGNIQFYMKMSSQRISNYGRLNEILTYYCKHNQKLTNKVIDQVIIKAINRHNHQDYHIAAYIDLASKLLSIDDKLKSQRTQRLLGIPSVRNTFIEAQNQDQNNSNKEFMIRKKNQRVVCYISNHVTESDEMMFPLLQLLYVNRQYVNCFTVSAVHCILKLAAQNKRTRKYLYELASPCLSYVNYMSWIPQFISKAIKNPSYFVTISNKINFKQYIQQGAFYLQQVELQEYQQHLLVDEQIDQQLYWKEQQLSEKQQRRRDEKQQQSHTEEEREWLERNYAYLPNWVVEKTPTRLINISVRLLTLPSDCINANPKLQTNNSASTEDSILSIPLTYYLLKTAYVSDWIQYRKKVLSFNPIQLPNQQFVGQSMRRTKFQEELFGQYVKQGVQQYKLIEVGFTGSYDSLLKVMKGEHSDLKIRFSHKQYPYSILIQKAKLTNSQSGYKLILPCPKQINIQQKHTHNIQTQMQLLMDKMITSLIEGEIYISSQIEQTEKDKNSIEIIKNEQQCIMKEKCGDYFNDCILNVSDAVISQQQSQLSQHYKLNLNHSSRQTYSQSKSIIDNSSSQTITNNQSQNIPNQQICIQCPFCSFIAHQFVSRCPNCNQEWGLYA